MSQREFKKRSNGVQTASLILEVAVNELRSVGPANFSVDRVQTEADVSRSSLYHHFGSREGLIVAATIQEIREELSSGISELRKFAETIDSGQVIVDYIKAAILDTSSMERRGKRLTRAGTFAAGRHSESVARALGEAEAKNLADFIDLLEYTKERKLLNPQEPLAGTIAVISSMLMGRIVVDFIEDKSVESGWVTVASDVVQGLLRPVS